MERIIDKLMLFVCCSAGFLVLQPSNTMVAVMLVALIVSALQEAELMPRLVRDGITIVYVAVALVIPEFVFFLPLISYDCFSMRIAVLRICWMVPLLAALRVFPPLGLLIVFIAICIAGIMSWRTARTISERIEFTNMRDELRELSLALECKNQDLQEKQDYEVKLATLSERGRIAREIHDNVGHLLTRSVLQIEALQVVHADDTQVKSELKHVGDTIHEALETVRESVHDLHDDSLDLYTQLFAIQKESVALQVELRYECSDVPPSVAYCLVAIAREAFSNALRHSDATKVEISVIEYPAFWQLIVQDNGTQNPFKGGKSSFSVAHVGQVNSQVAKLGDAGMGIGLKTMEERTRTLRGIFRIDYERGFRVFASIPKQTEVSVVGK